MATTTQVADNEIDFSRQPTTTHANANGKSSSDNGDDGEIPKNKRIACVICRKRKLKCDGNRPKCATCARLKHNCSYDEVRRKSGPKRGYVKELEARLAQVEAQVKTKDPSEDQSKTIPPVPGIQVSNSQNGFPDVTAESMGNMNMQNGVQFSMAEGPMDSLASNNPFSMSSTGLVPDMNQGLLDIPDSGIGLDDSFSWEMIGLGLEEPMPTPDAVDELTQIFFDKFHPSVPMIHRYRYYTSMNLAPQTRPPICLRYAMWAHAASITDKYMHHQDIFYRRSRKYLEMDEMKGAGETFVSVAHCQSWMLLSAYEFKMMYFPRAWMSTGRAARLALMLGLNRVDGIGLDVKQCLPPSQDWTEREERRRTFWMVYCCDRYASIGTGWPVTIDERDIKTNMPANEENFENGIPQKTPPLTEAMTHEQVAHMSPLAGVVYITHFFGLNLTHLHRPEPNDGEDDVQGPFWKRHRKMDNILLNTSLSLPSHLRLPAGVRSPNIVFLNFAIHAATICLHQAAIFKAEKNQLPRSVIEQSRARCILAASEIATVMRLTSHLDVSGMNPFMAFCLYVAARVFVQYLKKMPNDQEIRTSMEFLLTAMSALKRKHPLAESFMVQLNLDLEGTGLDIMLHNPDYTTVQMKATMNDGNVRERVAQSMEGPLPQYCSPAPSPNDGSSVDARTPSIRSESPRQTQYALRNIELQARESRQLPNFFPAVTPATSQLPGATPGQGWTTRATNEAPIGYNPILNNNIGVNGFDIDMTDNASFSNSNSTGITPQSSITYRTASTNSYSPPQVEEELSPQSNGNKNSATSPLVFTPPNDEILNNPNFMNATSPNTAPANGASGGHNTQQGGGEFFKVPSSWTMPTGNTPSFSGMSPDGGWEKMMQEAGMTWNEQHGGTGTGMTPK